MKVCPDCSTSCEDSDTYCISCGYKFDSGPENTEKPQQPPLNQDSVPIQTNRPPYNPYESYKQAPYGYNQPNNLYIQPKNNGFSVASLVLGICGLPFLCCYFFGVIPSILAIIFGFIGRQHIRTSPVTEKGSGMALAGIILGFCGIFIAILLIVLIVVLVHFSSAGGSPYSTIPYFNRQA